MLIFFCNKMVEVDYKKLNREVFEVLKMFFFGSGCNRNSYNYNLLDYFVLSYELFVLRKI